MHSPPPLWRRVIRVLSTPILVIGLLWLLGLFIYRPWSILIVGLLTLPRIIGGLYRRIRHGSPLCYEVRPLLWLVLFIGIVTYHWLPSPRHADWQTPWAKAPQFALEGNTLTVGNLRDFRYRSEHDYDPCYRRESYDLSTLTGADLGECHWDGMESICHTMLSFSFADGRHLVVSAETRLPKGVEQDNIGGIYKLYGLLYVFGTEEDIFALRTNHRHEDLTLYPLKLTPEQAKKTPAGLRAACQRDGAQAAALQHGDR